MPRHCTNPLIARDVAQTMLDAIAMVLTVREPQRRGPAITVWAARGTARGEMSFIHALDAAVIAATGGFPHEVRS